MNLLRRISIVGAGIVASAQLVSSDTIAAESRKAEIPGAKHYVAIDNVCAWPILTRLRDGAIMATIHNEPSHGLNEGDVECWRSEEGEFWHKIGTPAPHEPDTVRMNMMADCGYPSSVQRADGTIVTAFYSKAAKNHERYHMGVVIWGAPEQVQK